MGVRRELFYVTLLLAVQGEALAALCSPVVGYNISEFPNLRMSSLHHTSIVVLIP